jgi:hypothetical protein
MCAWLSARIAWLPSTVGDIQAVEVQRVEFPQPVEQRGELSAQFVAPGGDRRLAGVDPGEIAAGAEIFEPEQMVGGILAEHAWRAQGERGAAGDQPVEGRLGVEALDGRRNVRVLRHEGHRLLQDQGATGQFGAERAVHVAGPRWGQGADVFVRADPAELAQPRLDRTALVGGQLHQ